MKRQDFKSVKSPLKSALFKRRDFLRLAGISGAGLMLGIFPNCTDPRGIVNLRYFQIPEAAGVFLNPFIIIDTSGLITLVSHRPDVGNGTPQAMLMLLAEELEVDLSDINIIQAKTNEAVYGDQGIGYSNSIRGSYIPSRLMAAAARQMLIQCAARKWSVKEEECNASKGAVYHKPSNRSAAYGDLVEGASRLRAPKEPKLKKPEDFKIIGKSLPRFDILAKTNGTAIFGLDSRIEDMLYASIERSPVFHGKVRSFNSKEVLAVRGVKHVVKSEMRFTNNIREGVAVVADSYWAAMKGRKALRIEWDHQEMESWDSERIFNQYREDAKLEGQNHKSVGNVKKALKSAFRVFSAEYECPMMAHAPMEPPNMIADVRADNCLIIGPTQIPGEVKKELSELLNLPLESVEVFATVIGGGFGRKACTDFANEAAFLSKKIHSPVKVIWSREDDISQGPLRPGSINLLSAGCDDDNKIVALRHKVVSTDFYEAFGYRVSWLLDGVLSHGYDFPNMSYELVDSQVPFPYLWMRSVGSSGNGFAHECFIDELAHEIKEDPLDFRLKYLQNSPRFIKVLENLAIHSSWRDSIGSDKARGMAVLGLRNSVVGHVAELSRTEKGIIKIDRITVVIDCGIVVNPDIVKQQVEGACIMGLSSSFKKNITITRGRVDQKNYDSYPMFRYGECPQIDVHLIQSSESPGGIGEVGMPGVAPAVANAFFDLTSTRIRKLPFDIFSS